MLNLQKTDDGVIFRVKVQPASGKNEIVGVQGDALKIKINALPLKGKANKALVGFLARKLGVKNSGVKIILPYALIPTQPYKNERPDIGHCAEVLVIVTYPTRRRRKSSYSSVILHLSLFYSTRD